MGMSGMEFNGGYEVVVRHLWLFGKKVLRTITSFHSQGEPAITGKMECHNIEFRILFVGLGVQFIGVNVQGTLGWWNVELFQDGQSLFQQHQWLLQQGCRINIPITIIGGCSVPIRLGFQRHKPRRLFLLVVVVAVAFGYICGGFLQECQDCFQGLLGTGAIKLRCSLKFHGMRHDQLVVDRVVNQIQIQIENTVFQETPQSVPAL